MTTTRTPISDRERFYPDFPGKDRTAFLEDYFSGNREDDFIQGMKAFATAWFREFSDEQSLPPEWDALVAVAEHWMLFDDLSDLLPVEDEDDDE